MIVYGEPKLTRDIDITLGIGIEGLENIKNIAEKLNLKIPIDNPDEFVKIQWCYL
ncbi:MAG: hypothetical protein NC899_08280 [Candidatus Omnitrophica bacterium]|nr:hypothetical protein [Candidatus Omnitrophota bacterium]